MLGLFEHATFEEEAVALAPGDVIVAFSDGVSEAMNEAAEEYTDERLIASVQANRRTFSPGASGCPCWPTYADSVGAPRQTTM